VDGPLLLAKTLAKVKGQQLGMDALWSSIERYALPSLALDQLQIPRPRQVGNQHLIVRIHAAIWVVALPCTYNSNVTSLRE
jgi:hypothetical protein